MQLKAKRLVNWLTVVRIPRGFLLLHLLLTQLAASVPEGLRVEVGGVDTVGRRVDPGQLLLVELDEGRGFLLHHLVSFGLTE